MKSRFLKLSIFSNLPRARHVFFVECAAKINIIERRRCEPKGVLGQAAQSSIPSGWKCRHFPRFQGSFISQNMKNTLVSYAVCISKLNLSRFNRKVKTIKPTDLIIEDGFRLSPYASVSVPSVKQCNFSFSVF